jgi:hypothetical protein
MSDKERNKWLPRSDVKVCKSFDEALAFLKSGKRKWHGYQIGLEYFAEISGENKNTLWDDLKDTLS